MESDHARSDPARQVRFGIKTGASYGQEAYLTRNSGILLLLAEWKNGVGRYLRS